jgi:hypothetical protein
MMGEKLAATPLFSTLKKQKKHLIVYYDTSL